eukprot:3938589-Amphidinium_carterae.1
MVWGCQSSAQEAAKGNFVLTAGGDHSLGSATISGMRAVHKDWSRIKEPAKLLCWNPVPTKSVAYVKVWLRIFKGSHATSTEDEP